MATLNFIEALRTSLQRTRTYFDDNVTTLTNNVDTLKSRVDVFEEGSTISDAELQDIRVGVNGTVYDSAGEAVRGQVSKLSEEMKNVAAGGGVSASAKNLLITILRNGVYGNDQSDNINALETILFEDSDENNIIVTQSGSTLTISGYMATAIQQSGNVLMVS